jgi:hypothetical protein
MCSNDVRQAHAREGSSHSACTSDMRHIRYFVKHIGSEKGTVWTNRSNIAQWQEASVSTVAHGTVVGSG